MFTPTDDLGVRDYHSNLTINVIDANSIERQYQAMCGVMKILLISATVLLLNQTQVRSAHTAQTLYSHQVAAKESPMFPSGAKQGVQAAGASKTQMPQRFEGKGVVECVLSLWTPF